MGCGCCHHVFSLPGADFHNERIIVAPCGLHERAVERDAFAHVQQVAGRNIQQICAGIVVPCALQAIVQRPERRTKESTLCRGCAGASVWSVPIAATGSIAVDSGLVIYSSDFPLCAAPLFIH